MEAYCNITSWKNWGEKRVKLLSAPSTKLSESEDTTFIENCNWELKCPVALSKIHRTSDKAVDYCSVCKKSVYIVTSKEQLIDRVTQKQCVAIDFDHKVITSRIRKTQMKYEGMVRGRISIPK